MREAAATAVPPLGPLCEQQFWLFGCDVRRPAGNLLIERGFERLRHGPARPTRYLLETEEETIALWGFGMLWIPRGSGPGAFLGRDGSIFETAATGVPKVREAWRAKRQLKLAAAADPALGAAALAWIARYERWVVDAGGRAHRRRALAETAACCGTDLILIAWEEHARSRAQAAAQQVA